jgi:hypothetical protein
MTATHGSSGTQHNDPLKYPGHSIFKSNGLREKGFLPRNKPPCTSTDATAARLIYAREYNWDIFIDPIFPAPGGLY